MHLPTRVTSISPAVSSSLRWCDRVAALTSCVSSSAPHGNAFSPRRSARGSDADAARRGRVRSARTACRRGVCHGIGHDGIYGGLACKSRRRGIRVNRRAAAGSMHLLDARRTVASMTRRSKPSAARRRRHVCERSDEVLVDGIALAVALFFFPSPRRGAGAATQDRSVRGIRWRARRHSSRARTLGDAHPRRVARQRSPLDGYSVSSVARPLPSFGSMSAVSSLGKMSAQVSSIAGVMPAVSATAARALRSLPEARWWRKDRSRHSGQTHPPP